MIAAYALLGLVVGACINLCADTHSTGLPRCRSPFCLYCDQPRPLSAWSTTFAFLRFRTTCRHCGAPISWRSLLVELGTAGLFALLWYQYGPSVLLVLFSIYSALLVLIGIVDFEQRRIPNKLVYPGWILAVAGSLVSPSESFWLRAILGGVAGFVILYLIHLGSKVFLRMAKFQGKPDGPAEFGLGDVRLGALIGLMLGVPWVFTALLLGVLLGGIAALLFWFFRAVIRRDYVPLTVMAYGPWLAGGALLTMLLQPVVHLPGLQG